MGVDISLDDWRQRCLTIYGVFRVAKVNVQLPHMNVKLSHDLVARFIVAPFSHGHVWVS